MSASVVVVASVPQMLMSAMCLCLSLEPPSFWPAAEDGALLPYCGWLQGLGWPPVLPNAVLRNCVDWPHRTVEREKDLDRRCRGRWQRDESDPAAGCHYVWGMLLAHHLKSCTCLCANGQILRDVVGFPCLSAASGQHLSPRRAWCTCTTAARPIRLQRTLPLDLVAFPMRSDQCRAASRLDCLPPPSAQLLLLGSQQPPCYQR